ncbi:alpha-L-fucosidase [Flavitalea sp. BT771]|uniref:alpha-L-fucosidase n=1 Tax=Flavitalea sp. BT771 TaxID=3063329 RepID=UPI0026E3A102|nr:alpha-L-fucosidase [Flavitalea sp. BT771]MDO6435687.1 alpha-L-fucosidase [Flavitalea sp. BT771]MDV6224588.1 alpha-L-fucosidase [Flavitalea sp. BT771]
MINFLSRCISAVGLLFSVLSTCEAQPLNPPDRRTISAVEPPAPNKMDWWRKARFGMFIHWGVYSVPAGIYHGKAYDGLGEWLMQDAHIPRAEYAAFARQFNPKHYDPEKWVLLAKQAGMKYIVITAKHHDGFALFPSKASSWNIADATPYRKDLLMPLVLACRKHDMKIGFYYSQANDWYNPGGAAANGHWDSAQTTRTMDEYLDKVAVPQVKEILTRYGDVAELWWDVPSDMTQERAAKFNAALALQPGIVTNDRLGGNIPGDITTPEQYVPGTGVPGRDWETCMTINDTWGYKVNDNNWKSTYDIVKNLIDIASKGGNYLLNVGPDAEGRFPEAIVARLQGVGRWMEKYGESIYGTTASPFTWLPWGRCTRRVDDAGTTLYFHVLHWPKDGRLLVPGFAGKVISAEVMQRHDKVTTLPGDEGLLLDVSQASPDSLITVIKLRIDGKVMTPDYVVSPDPSDSYNLLPQQAVIDNHGANGYARMEGGEDNHNIGYWTDTASNVAWKIKVPRGGTYIIWGTLSTSSDASAFAIEIGNETLKCRLPDTGGYEDYTKMNMGRITIPGPGIYTVRMTPQPDGWQPVNVRSIQLKKTN